MKQIFLLDNTELDNLHHGVPLELALPGGTVIQLQAENPRRKYTTNNNTPDGTISQRIINYLTTHGPSRSIDIIHGLSPTTRSSITSCLTSNRQHHFKSVGHHTKRLWRLK